MNLPLEEPRSWIEQGAITYDSLPYDYISDLHHRHGEKIFNPIVNEDATEELFNLRESWRNDQVITVFTSGVFDLLHMDHAGYLLHTKAAGAALHYEEFNLEPWEELSPEEQREYTSDILSQEMIKLVVSVDGDKSVSNRKAAKGGFQRPVYSWQTRAMMVASQSFVDPRSNESRLLPTVDAVTAHGPDDFPENSIHSSHFRLVEKLQPDMWAIFGESIDILEGAPNIVSLGNVALRCILDREGTHYFKDGFLSKITTTKIVERILGTEII